MTQTSTDLSVETYRSLLKEDEVGVVYTLRKPVDWLTKLNEEINFSISKPLQVWLINEPITFLDGRLNKAFIDFGISNYVASVLKEDILSLTNFFVSLSGDLTPFVSIRTIDERYFENQEKSVSRDWHIDTAVLTLSCVYVGKGTQWLIDASKIRSQFANQKIPTSISIEPENQNVHEMTSYEVSVLKGEIRINEDRHSKEFLNTFLKDNEVQPFNEGKGLLHRGPGFILGDSRRLLLTISTMRIPLWLK